MVIASLLTGASRAAVSTIAVRGQAAEQIVLAAFQTAGPGAIRTGQVRYGIWHGGDQFGIGESVVVSRNDDCNIDSTVTQCWEIHCHGGVIAANRILNDLKRLGVVIFDQSQWLNERHDSAILTSESVEVLTNAVSARTAAIALDQARGAMTQFVVKALQQLQDSSIDHASVKADIAGQAKRILRFTSLGLHLSTPWRVVLAGPPNVGKSSLINALVGYRRSITIDMPGTTRDVLEAQTVIDGWPVRLSDTAGIRDNAECAIETAGIESAIRELESADLILWVEDASDATQPGINTTSESNSKPTIKILNKIDRVVDMEDLPSQESTAKFRQVRTAATTGFGIDDLRQAISNLLVQEVPDHGSPIPITSRQVLLLQKLSVATNKEEATKFLGQLIQSSRHAPPCRNQK